MKQHQQKSKEGKVRSTIWSSFEQKCVEGKLLHIDSTKITLFYAFKAPSKRSQRGSEDHHPCASQVLSTGKTHEASYFAAITWSKVPRITANEQITKVVDLASGYVRCFNDLGETSSSGPLQESFWFRMKKTFPKRHDTKQCMCWCRIYYLVDLFGRGIIQAS